MTRQAVYVCPECGAYLVRSLGCPRTTCKKCLKASSLEGRYPIMRARSLETLRWAVDLLGRSGVMIG